MSYKSDQNYDFNVNYSFILEKCPIEKPITHMNEMCVN